MLGVSLWVTLGHGEASPVWNVTVRLREEREERDRVCVCVSKNEAAKTRTLSELGEPMFRGKLPGGVWLAVLGASTLDGASRREPCERCRRSRDSITVTRSLKVGRNVGVRLQQH